MNPALQKIPIAFLLVILSSTLAIAQRQSLKFGEVSEKELLMDNYAADTGVHAVVLGDYGQSHFVFTADDGFELVFERHVRIKILDQYGTDWANFSIPLYYNHQDTEKLNGLKGFTFNLENEKTVQSKLRKEGIFNEEASENWKFVKVAFPDVKAGSVIDLSYSVRSAFLFNLQQWVFQRSIPVLYSEYVVKIPEYFTYNQLLGGYDELDSYENTYQKHSSTGIFNQDGMGGRGHIGKMDWTNLVQIYVMDSLSAFKSESYMTTMDDYISKIEFELISIQFPNSTVQTFTGTWRDLNNTFIESKLFGEQLTKGGFVKDALSGLKLSGEQEQMDMLKIYQFVKKHMKWNGIDDKFARQSLKKAFDNRSGNSAEINLLLVLMLREAGFDANPVVLSTRDHGVIRKSFPALKEFNYAIAAVKLNDKVALLDASDPLLSAGLLPQKCLNQTGRLISKTSPDWIPLNPKQKYRSMTAYNLQLHEDGQFSGSIHCSRNNFSSYLFRKSYYSAKSKEEFTKELEESNNNLQVEEFSITNIDNLYSLIKDTLIVKITGEAQMAGNLIYFSPVFYEKVKENPFKLEKRSYPVDYAYLRDEYLTVKVKLPKGYKIESLPKPALITLPENAAKFSFNIAEQNGQIVLTSVFSVNKTMFLPSEYGSLKEFHRLLIAKQAEQIVLKKN